MSLLDKFEQYNKKRQDVYNATSIGKTGYAVFSLGFAKEYGPGKDYDYTYANVLAIKVR